MFPYAPGQLINQTDAPSSRNKNCYGALKRSSQEASSERRYTNAGGTNFAALPGARRLDSGSAARFFYCAKADSMERGTGNNHPTVKPSDLCRYLAKLILPPERETPRRIIVPFSGSGSEMLGALIAGWDEIVGIEREEKYIEIAKGRLGKHCPLFA
jgi:site-specific DNA-methyltransferase (adenine-specific)